MESISAKGHNGQVYFDGKTVTIRREGALARANHGRGDKTIHMRHIAGVQFKPAGSLTNGFIQFTVPGEISGRSSKGGRTIDAAKDENAVIFLKKHQQEFDALREAINSAVAELV